MSLGTFADETAFKHKYMKLVLDDKERYKTILAIENTVEPGMPDLIVVEKKGRSVFIEAKYARHGRITFTKTQIPWYRRHTNLPIFILAYNDKTENLHLINASCIIANADGLSFKLDKEEHYEIRRKI
jgi:hypothetical protein